MPRSNISQIKSPGLWLLSTSLLLMFWACSHGVVAQRLDPQKHITQYILKGWNTKDGLASESVNEIAQTNDGYIWIATFAGLHRFDGKEFTIFNSQNSPLPSSNVLRVEKGVGDALWLGTLNGLALFKDGKISVPDGLKETSRLSIEDMLVSKSGDIWFSTKSNRLFQYREGKLEEFTEKFNVGKSTVLAIAEDNEGNVYFGTDDSRLIKHHSEGFFSEIVLDKVINGINDMLYKNGLLYLGTGNGILLWDGSELIKSSILENTTVNTILLDDDKTIWLGTMRGLFRFTPFDSRLDSLTEDNGIPNNIVEDLLFDSEGNLWVGTYRNGIFLLTDGSITSYTKNDGLATDIITSVTEKESGTYLLGNENGELNLLKNGKISLYKPPIDIPQERLKNLFTDSKGKVWISTYGGLVVINGNQGHFLNVSNGLPDNFIRVAFEDSQGTIWVGTKNAGLLLFENDKLDQWKSISIDDGLSSNFIMSIKENASGEILVGTINGLNIIKDRKVIKTVTVDDGLPSNFMFSTHSTPRYTWIASNDGLTGYSSDKIVNFNTENGFPSNIIYDVLEDSEGNLWMPSENTILRVSIENLEAAAEDSTVAIKVKQYDESYGLKNSHCLGAVLSYKDSKGRFWIPTIQGVVCLDPESIKPPTVRPKMIVEAIYANGAPLAIGQGEVVVPAKTERLLIDFTGISYKLTNRLQFRYRLIPFDDTWILASSERNAIYTNLPPGSYTFELQSGIDGSFYDRTLTQKIIIEAAWWQTIWAKIGFVLFVIGFSLFIYWMRTRRIRQNTIRLEKLVSERTKELEEQKEELKNAIKKLKSAQEQMVQSDKMASLGILAAGVAHEINNPLNFIKGGVEGLEQKLKNSRKIKQDEYGMLIGAIKEGISRAATIVSSLNEFSHSSDKKMEPCDIHHLIDNCITMIQYRLKHGIKLKKEYTDKPAIVLGNNGKLHQAFLNILTNAIQAMEKTGTITIKTEVADDQITVEFTDTGHGIKPEHLKKITEPFFSTKDPGQGTGLGLSITYNIIREHKGRLSYTSEWGKGTTATVVLPAMKK